MSSTLTQALGDYKEDYATLNFKFLTLNLVTGVPTALLNTPVVSVYKGSSTTQSVAGITLAVEFDSVVGLNNVLIDLSADAFYAVGEDYSVVLTAGEVNSVSVIGTVLATFSIQNRSPISGLVTAALAAVNAELVDVFDTDTHAEIAQGTPSATPTILYMLQLAYKALRNRTTESTTQFSIYNDDGVTVDHKKTVSDNSTIADAEEMISG